MKLTKKQEKILNYLNYLYELNDSIVGITGLARVRKIDPVYNSLINKNNLMISTARGYKWNTIKPNIHMANQLISLYDNRLSASEKLEKEFKQLSFEEETSNKVSLFIDHVTEELNNSKNHVKDIYSMIKKHNQMLDGCADYVDSNNKDIKLLTEEYFDLNLRTKRLEKNIEILNNRILSCLESINRPWWKKIFGSEN